MARNRVDTLEERVRRLRAMADRLCEEYAAVRSRVDALEAAVAGASPDRDGARPRSQGASTHPSAARTADPDDQSSTEQDGSDEATDAEVAAAIRAVENARDEAAANERSDDILIA